MPLPSSGRPHLRKPDRPGKSGRAKHRRRWMWITSAIVVGIIALAGIVGKPPATGAPAVGNAGTTVTSSVATSVTTSESSSVTASSTTPAPVAAPLTTTDAPAVVPPAAPPVVVAPRTTTHHVTPKPAPKPVPPPVAPPVVPPVAPPAPVTGPYHAGEFCKTLGATAISTNGDHMTCVQEGKYKRWQND